MSDAQRTNLLKNFFQRLEQCDRLSQAERTAMADAAGTVGTIRAGADIVSEGSEPQTSTLLIDGIAAGYTVLASGSRKITAFQIAGDFVDLQFLPLRVMDYGVGAITDCTVVSFPHSALLRITEQHPHLARLLWMTTLMDGAIYRQWLVVTGRMSALGRMAHFFCEHFIRARTAGLLLGPDRFPFPVTQIDLADALGLSVVHVNRTLQELRRLGYLSWEHSVVEIIHFDALVQLGEFDARYLNLRHVPR